MPPEVTLPNKTGKQGCQKNGGGERELKIKMYKSAGC
jgi:hypothetical protein